MNYINSLKHFEDGEVLNDILRDKLGCGINHERTQQCSVGECSSLILEKALDISLPLESAIIQASLIQKSAAKNHKLEVNKAILKVSKNGKSKRYHFDWNHSAKSCLSIDKECFYCHDKGHTTRGFQKKAKSVG